MNGKKELWSGSRKTKIEPKSNIDKIEDVSLTGIDNKTSFYYECSD